MLLDKEGCWGKRAIGRRIQLIDDLLYKKNYKFYRSEESRVRSGRLENSKMRLINLLN